MKTPLVLVLLITMEWNYCSAVVAKEVDTGVSGGALYTRWGANTCPDTPGTELVYTGLAGGSLDSSSGGGANFLCLPNTSEYLQNAIAPLASFLAVANYGSSIFTSSSYNVPCAVCYNSLRSSKLMIPAKITCPLSWTEEYEGYLMTKHSSHHNNVLYECVDKSGETVPVSCNDLPCPPYRPYRAINCVVCTK